MLKVKLLTPDATAPTVSTPGEDIGYDLYASEDVLVEFKGTPTVVKTGVAIEFVPKAGATIGTRSSIAKRGLYVIGGIIDAGYRGECTVLLMNMCGVSVEIKKGERVAQLIRNAEIATDVIVAEELSESKRGVAGFGSSGK